MRFPWTKPRPIVGMSTAQTDELIEIATEADVMACFRLLLGRSPNPEEWRGHSMRAGERLSSVVSSYLTSLEFKRRGLLEDAMPTDIALTELQDFSIYTSGSDAAVGKHVRGDNYEHDITSLFRSVLKKGMSVVDLGANIGYFTLLSASLVGPMGKVLAIEPNPRNVRMLEASRRLNGFDHVTICQTAAGRETGLLILNTSYSNGTTSDLPDDSEQLFASEIVPSVRLDSLLGAETWVDLIKVDVEGAELNALIGGEATLRRCRPFIISEFSPSMMPGISKISGEDYLKWLVSLGYELSVVAIDGSLTNSGTDTGMIMRSYQERMTDHIDIVARAA